jgi:cephalosporin-C deacetylase-like acetyl esterase
VEFLKPIALASRLQDSDVMSLLFEAAGGSEPGRRMGQMIATELVALDRDEDAQIAAMGWKRVSFPGADGFPLSGLVAAPSTRGKARAAVILMPPEHGWQAWDTLASSLRAQGFAVMMVEIRGSGRSVHPTCPLPESWRGREVDLQTRTARDVVPALRALAAATPVDTTRYLLGGSLAAAAMAVEAATLDRRARVLLLVSPLPSPVDRGTTRARLATLGLPVFFQSAPEDFEAVPVADLFFHAVDERASRLAESERVGSGPHVFRHDPGALPRLKGWLGETWTRAATSAPRRSGPRGG